VLDETLKDGHALGGGRCARDRLTADRGGLAGDESARGTRYPALCAGDAAGVGAQRFEIGGTEVAVEDLKLADLDGDGRLDIIAAGRQTKNVRIFFNLGTAK
jgi:hypothetical protein